MADQASLTTSKRLVPPAPEPAPDTMGPLELARRMRTNGITPYTRRAYEGEVVQRRYFGRTRPWCTDQGCGRNDPYPVLGSCDAGGLRASQLQHAVEDIDRHVHLSRPTLIGVRAQPVPDHALEPADGGLGPGARIVARGLLPAHPALLGDELQVAVPLRRRGLG